MMVFGLEAHVTPSTGSKGDSRGRIQARELFHALRGIWELEGQEMVLEIDQETGELLACTYEGEQVDPRPIITRGTQVRPFESIHIGN